MRVVIRWWLPGSSSDRRRRSSSARKRRSRPGASEKRKGTSRRGLVHPIDRGVGMLAQELDPGSFGAGVVLRGLGELHEPGEIGRASCRERGAVRVGGGE